MNALLRVAMIRIADLGAFTVGLLRVQHGEARQAQPAPQVQVAQRGAWRERL